MIKCKCGRLMVENDGHWICEKYLEDIKKGVKQQVEIIEGLNRELNGEIII